MKQLTINDLLYFVAFKKLIISSAYGKDTYENLLTLEQVYKEHGNEEIRGIWAISHDTIEIRTGGRVDETTI